MAHQEGVEVVHPEEQVVEAVDSDLHLEEAGSGHLQVEVDSDLHLVAVDRGLLQENEVFTLIMCFVNIVKPDFLNNSNKTSLSSFRVCVTHGFADAVPCPPQLL